MFCNEQSYGPVTTRISSSGSAQILHGIPSNESISSCRSSGPTVPASGIKSKATASNLYFVIRVTTNASHNKLSQVLEFTLYLIRHGEASHNVLEKIAKKQALEQALAEGLHKDDEVTKERMENARQHVLLDNTLFDAPLSDLGHNEAKQA